jgi:hypothetical protein
MTGEMILIVADLLDAFREDSAREPGSVAGQKAKPPIPTSASSSSQGNLSQPFPPVLLFSQPASGSLTAGSGRR